jgi:hypothetical protein
MSDATAQRFFDSRAIEIASEARQIARDGNEDCDKAFDLLRTDMSDIRKSVASIHTAMWGAAIGLIGLLGAWVFELATKASNGHP